MNSDFSLNDYKYLNNIVKKYSNDIFYHRINNVFFNDIASKKFKLAKESYYRLLIPEIFDFDFVLYIDVDTLILKDLKFLFNLPMDNYPIAAVKDFEDIKHLNSIIPNKSKYYFNSGVMILNLNIWRAENLKEKIISFIESNPDLIFFGDQCGLNAIITSNWFMLENNFNFQLGFYKYNKILFNVLDNAIIHFTSNKNFKNFVNFNQDAQKLFFYFLKKSNYNNYNLYYLQHLIFKYFYLPIYKIYKSIKINYL